MEKGDTVGPLVFIGEEDMPVTFPENYAFLAVGLGKSPTLVKHV